jgi:hypothetical protein
MRRILVSSILLAVLLAVPAVAQGGGRGDPNGPPETRDSNYNSVSEFDRVTKFGTSDAGKYIDLLRQRARTVKGKSVGELLAEDKASATALVSMLKLPCTVTNAVLVAEDATALTKTYEVVCDSRVGYFLVQSTSPGKSSAFSCFAADAARLADIAAHREPSIVCSLPENIDAKASVSAILAIAGRPCTVQGTRWMGQSATTNTDFLEVACQGGDGLVVSSPLPGARSPLKVDTCHASALRGLPCRLSDNGVTLQTFKDALAQHGVSCDAENMRLVGRETIKRRHVVEFLCPKQHPEGLVAFIPADTTGAPFEVMDCQAAAKQQVACRLTPVK